MNDIITVAGYTLRRYIKNPFAIVLFLVAPILIFAFISGSTIQNFIPNIKSFPGGSCLQNNFVSPPEGMKTTDKECIVFMLMYLFYFAVLSCHSVTTDLKNGLNARFKASPVGPYKNILGKSIGNLILILGFTAVTVIAGQFVFGINFGSNFAATFCALFLFCLITNSFGILLSLFIRNVYVCGILIFAIDFPMMFIVMHKIFSPMNLTPLFKFMDIISLHSHAIDIIVTAGAEGLLPLLIIAAVITPLSLVAGRWVLK